jgi:hypothetical protein
MLVNPAKLLIFAILLFLCSAFFLLRGHWRPPDTGFQKRDFLMKQARHPLVIHGFQFARNHQGEENITIKAARLRIEKRKFGLFSLGSLRIAKFKGAEIDIFVKQVISEKKLGNDSQKPNYRLKETFTKEATPVAGFKNVISFHFEPVIINFYNGKSLITQIQADLAGIESKDRRIVFRGNVLATSENRSLTADQLIFFPAEGLFKSGRRAVLKTPDDNFSGESIKTDLLLNPTEVTGSEM